MEILVVILARLITDLHAAVTAVPLAAASQRVGFIAASCELNCSTSISFTYCIFFST